MTEGHEHSLWGCSPALDLTEVLCAFSGAGAGPSREGEPASLRYLLVTSGDVRHILKTVAQRRRHRPRGAAAAEIEFVVYEDCAEVLARDLALLRAAMEWERPIRARGSLFLELFGNAFVQRRTEAWLSDAAAELERTVCDGAGALAPLLNLDELRYRERDALQTAVRGLGDGTRCDMEGFLDRRRRHIWKERFDSRRGLIDWDYQTRVGAAASIIHPRLYSDWRLSGVAFEFGDCRYTQPNRTMVTFVAGLMKRGHERGLKKELMGYWSDMKTSPFVALGVDCDTRLNKDKRAEKLFEIYNKGSGAEQHRHNAGEVAAYNLLCYLWEMETGRRYEMRRDHDIFSGLGDTPLDEAAGAEAPEADEADKTDEAGEAAGPVPATEAAEDGGAAEERAKAVERARCILETLRGVRVTLVTGDFSAVLRKAQHRGAFDGIFVGAMGAQRIAAQHRRADADASVPPVTLRDLLREDGFLAAENGRHLAELAPEGVGAFQERIEAMAAAAGLARQPWRNLASCWPGDPKSAKRGHLGEVGGGDPLASSGRKGVQVYTRA